MIALEMAKRILGVFPSSFIGTNGAQTAMEPLFFIDAKEDAVYLAGATIMVVTCLAARQLPRQRLLRDTPDEDHREYRNRGWITASTGASGLHPHDVCVEYRSGTGPLAVTDGAKWVQCDPRAHVLLCGCLLVLVVAIARRSLIVLWNGEGAERESAWKQICLSFG